MTYQCFSGVGTRVSVVMSVMSAEPAQEGQALGDDEVEDRDEDAHGEADDEHEHRQVDRLLARRPGDLLQLRPRFVEVSTEALDHVGDAFFRLRLWAGVAGAAGLEPTTTGFGAVSYTHLTYAPP